MKNLLRGITLALALAAAVQVIYKTVSHPEQTAKLQSATQVQMVADTNGPTI